MPSSSTTTSSTRLSDESRTVGSNIGPILHGVSRVEINTHFGGRGVYFADPDNHLLELITKPYGPEADL